MSKRRLVVLPASKKVVRKLTERELPAAEEPKQKSPAADNLSIRTWKNPEQFLNAVSFGVRPLDTAEWCVVLGLDPGVITGYAFGFYFPSTKRIVYPAAWTIGAWDLSIGNYCSGAAMFVRLQYFLETMNPSLIYMESTPIVSIRSTMSQVRAFSLSNQELLAAFRATVATWAENKGIPCDAVSVASLKKYATGKGNANKIDMIKECNKRFNCDIPEKESNGYDDMADASFLCAKALEEVAAGLPFSFQKLA